MSEISAAMLSSFRVELEKMGAPWWHPILGGAGGGAGLGAAVGALGGAGVGAYRRYQEAKERGENGVGAGVAGAFSGAGRGALIGAGAGGLLGAGLGKISPSSVDKMRELPGALGSFARAGQRQAHGLTGWTPVHGDVNSIEKLRMGAYGPRKALDAAKEKAVLELAKPMSDASFKALNEKHTNALLGRAKGLKAATEAQDMGLTNLPGYVRALRDPKHTTGQVLSTAAKDQWHNMPGWAKAMTVGIPAIDMYQAAQANEDVPNMPGKAERFGRAAGGAAAGLTLGGLPMMTGMAAQGLVSGAAGKAGRGVDFMRKKFRGGDGGIQAPKDNTQYGGETVPTERIMSDRAQGIAPESPV